jgi:predicted nucleic acid-binding protein
MRIVVDTIVWVSALINPNGTPARIINHPAAFDLLTSAAIRRRLKTRRLAPETGASRLGGVPL